jgi:hypothetical protein
MLPTAFIAPVAEAKSSAPWRTAQTLASFKPAPYPVYVGGSAHGDLLAMWDAGTSKGLYVASRGAKNVSFGTPFAIPAGTGKYYEPGGRGSSSLATNRAGLAILVWAIYAHDPAASAPYLDQRFHVYASVGTITGKFAAPVYLGDGNAGEPSFQIKVNERGDAFVAWEDYDGDAVRGSFRPAGGQFGSAEPVTRYEGQTVLAKDGHFSPASIGLDEQGNVYAFWVERKDWIERRVAFAVRHPDEGRFGEPEVLDIRGPDDLSMAVDHAGNATLGLTEVTDDYSFRVATRPAGGPIGAFHTLEGKAAGCRFGRVRADAQGNAVLLCAQAGAVAWNTYRSGDSFAPPARVARPPGARCAYRDDLFTPGLDGDLYLVSCTTVKRDGKKMAVLKVGHARAGTPLKRYETVVTYPGDINQIALALGRSAPTVAWLGDRRAMKGRATWRRTEVQVSTRRP